MTDQLRRKYDLPSLKLQHELHSPLRRPKDRGALGVAEISPEAPAAYCGHSEPFRLLRPLHPLDRWIDRALTITVIGLLIWFSPEVVKALAKPECKMSRPAGDVSFEDLVPRAR